MAYNGAAVAAPWSPGTELWRLGKEWAMGKTGEFAFLPRYVLWFCVWALLLRSWGSAVEFAGGVGGMLLERLRELGVDSETRRYHWDKR